MKKNILKLMLLGIVLIGAFAIARVNIKNQKTTVQNASNSREITQQRAEDIAFKHANVSRNNVQIRKIELDWENGRRVYEIEFYSNNTKYEYDIDANTGEVIGYSIKDRSGKNIDRNINQNNNNNNYIGIDRAKQIALSRVAGANNSHVGNVKLDREDGRMVYEGKIVYNGTEYEFDIDATTGEVVKWEVEKW